MNISNGLNNVNVNTIVVPLTVIFSVIAGTWYVSNHLNAAFEQSSNNQKDLGYKIEKVETRMTSIESIKLKNQWNSVDMFKWAVHLQQSNPSIKVPEPKHEENE